MYKKGVFERKEGGLSLKKEGVWGFSRRKKKRGPGGPRNEKKEGAGGSNFGGGVSLPLTFFNGIALRIIRNLYIIYINCKQELFAN